MVKAARAQVKGRRRPPNPNREEQTIRLGVTPVEFDHILAGLRHLQRTLGLREEGFGTPGMFGVGLHKSVLNIATDKGELMTSEEIDSLCEEMNLGVRDVKP